MPADPTTASPRGRPRVLVVRLSSLGDVLHALPAVAALRRAWPHARIEWLVEDRFAEAIDGSPEVDGVVVFPRAALRTALRTGRVLGAARALSTFLHALRRGGHDVAVDLQGNLKSGALAWLSGARRRVGVSRRDAREGNALFTNRRARALAAHAHRVERALSVVSALLGRAVASAGTPPPRLPDTAALAPAVDASLARAGLPARGFVTLHPGTSGFGAFKRWPPASFARLAEGLARDLGAAVAVVHGPGEEDLARAVAAAARDAPVAVLAPASLGHLAETLARARLVVAADTGPLHLAAARGVPVLGLYGPKDPAVYGPWVQPVAGEDARAARARATLVRAAVPCRPCGLRWCPEPVCMTSLAPADVLARALSLAATPAVG